MIGISNKQGKMLAFIETFVGKNGYPPTHEEIKTGLNISTKSLVNYHLQALEQAALIIRRPNTPRGLRLTSGKKRKSSPKQSNLQTTNNVVTLDQADVLELTYEMVMNENNLYALKVHDDTIIDAQTTTGDVVILKSQSEAQNGETVAIRLLDQGMTVLKQYYRENGHVRLVSNNDSIKTLFVNPDAVEIQGKVVAVIKQVN